jgi:hypothetical protein
VKGNLDHNAPWARPHAEKLGALIRGIGAIDSNSTAAASHTDTLIGSAMLAVRYDTAQTQTRAAATAPAATPGS